MKPSFTDLLFVEFFAKTTKDVIVIHHIGTPKFTVFLGNQALANRIQYLDCGLTHTKNHDIKESLKEKAPQLASQIDQFDFGNYDGSDMKK